MPMTIEEFCDKHEACNIGRSWAVKHCRNMNDVWNYSPGPFLLWVATRAGVLTHTSKAVLIKALLLELHRLTSYRSIERLCDMHIVYLHEGSVLTCKPRVSEESSGQFRERVIEAMDSIFIGRGHTLNFWLSITDAVRTLADNTQDSASDDSLVYRACSQLVTEIAGIDTLDVGSVNYELALNTVFTGNPNLASSRILSEGACMHKRSWGFLENWLRSETSPNFEST